MEPFTIDETVHYSIRGKHYSGTVVQVSKSGHRVTVSAGPMRGTINFTRRAHGQHVESGTDYCFLHHGPPVNGYEGR